MRKVTRTECPKSLQDNAATWTKELLDEISKQENPILDPSKDEISDYLELNLTTGEYIAINNNPRAETTKLHTGLNREQLVKARQKLILDIVKRYKSYEDSSKAEEFLKDIIILKEDYNFPSLKDAVVDYILTYNNRRK